MADCKNDCTGNCTDACTSCTGNCTGYCTGCSGCTSCLSGCLGTCVKNCSETCNSSCEGNCYTTCSTSCYNTCSEQCKGYCAEICQTYCQKEQVFSKNVSPTENPSNDKGSFNWSNPVEKNETIKITAKDWNTLKSYIQEATEFCKGISPSLPNVSQGDPITAKQYNDLANGIDLENVTANQTIITAKIINDLKNTYNERKILDSKPNGEYDNSTGANKCCQKGMICMSSGELLSHQIKTEECKNQAVSSCGNQT